MGGKDGASGSLKKKKNTSAAPSVEAKSELTNAPGINIATRHLTPGNSCGPQVHGGRARVCFQNTKFPACQRFSMASICTAPLC